VIAHAERLALQNVARRLPSRWRNIIELLATRIPPTPTRTISVPGATWPNRLCVLTGQAAGTRDDVTPPLYALPSFVRHLEAHNVDWRWYSFHPGTLRAADPAYASRTTSVSSKELFVIVYDEHGGFYEDVPRPSAVDDHPGFSSRLSAPWRARRRPPPARSLTA
jgi:phospholipase C